MSTLGSLPNFIPELRLPKETSIGTITIQPQGTFTSVGKKSANSLSLNLNSSICN